MDEFENVKLPNATSIRLDGCSGCRHRKMDGCTQGRSHYPNGGQDVCFDTRKRKGFSLYVNRHHDKQ